MAGAVVVSAPLEVVVGAGALTVFVLVVVSVAGGWLLLLQPAKASRSVPSVILTETRMDDVFMIWFRGVVQRE